jgi:hypothetical protein
VYILLSRPSDKWECNIVWIVSNKVGCDGLDLSGSVLGPLEGYCEYDNGSLG